MYEYKFYEEAEKDLSKLSNNIKLLFVKKLAQIIKNPEIGKDLGNKNNLKLSGLKKVYFDDKRYRIVYEVIAQEIIIHIVAIGKRDNMEVYKKADQRHQKYKKP
ncbi:MAG: type II toxin-antitoxin system RelE/ParE family toxin [Campylobacterales bacterium]|nr:type II toxin-antitoxin system RelE/ParE family toxin [Campylobacterales bacterium]